MTIVSRSCFLAMLMLLGGGVLFPAFAVADEMQASIARGGRLYDNWFKEIRRLPPALKHPAYPLDKGDLPDAASTWRCSACHGWDYKGHEGAYSTGAHYTGIKGIRAMADADPARVIAVLSDTLHGLSELDLLDESDFRDLANFVSKGQVDMDVHIDPISGRAKGTADAHHAYYQTICANCHGKDGMQIRDMPALGKLARENPWEILHNMLNGHPDEQMPVLRTLDRQVLVDVLAYLQTFPREDSLASITRGGRLYDNWYREIGAQAPSRAHPSYPRSGRYARSAKANWRCKECHGWDYKGRDGAYANGPHATGIKGIRAMDGASPARILQVLKDDTHRYRGELSDRAMMSERDLDDLANFVSGGQVDMDVYIDRVSKKAKGQADRQRALYATICASCHGNDGMLVSALSPLGEIARENPWRAMHTILNGHPEMTMPPLRVLGDLSVVADIVTYLQTLPPNE